MNLSTKAPQPSTEPEHRSSKPGGGNDRATQGAQPAQDKWFDQQLNQLFENVVNEPMPPDLAELIGRLKAQEQGK